MEVNLAIICACLTTLKPLLARLFPRLLATTASSNTYGPGKSIGRARESVAVPSHRVQGTVVVDERSFLELDSDAKSDDGFPIPMRDLEEQRKRDFGVAEPNRAYTKYAG